MDKSGRKLKRGYLASDEEEQLGDNPYAGSHNLTANNNNTNGGNQPKKGEPGPQTARSDKENGEDRKCKKKKRVGGATAGHLTQAEKERNMNINTQGTRDKGPGGKTEKERSTKLDRELEIEQQGEGDKTNPKGHSVGQGKLVTKNATKKRREPKKS